MNILTHSVVLCCLITYQTMSFIPIYKSVYIVYNISMDGG